MTGDSSCDIVIDNDYVVKILTHPTIITSSASLTFVAKLLDANGVAVSGKADDMDITIYNNDDTKQVDAAAMSESPAASGVYKYEFTDSGSSVGDFLKVQIEYATSGIEDWSGVEVGYGSESLASKIDTIDGNVDAILVDTGTDIPASLVTIDTNIDSILEDTGTTLPTTLSSIDGKIDTVDGIVDAILIDTDEIQGKLPTDQSGKARRNFEQGR